MPPGKDSRWRSGKEQALDSRSDMDRFLAGVERRAYRMAWFATGDREDALEIVQESMIGLVRHYASRTPEEWPALFHTVLQSRIRDWHRRHKVRARFRYWFGGAGHDSDAHDPNDPLDSFAAPEHVEPEARAADAETLTAVDRALRALPPRQQQAFLLRAWEGLDTAETARVMGLSEGSVKTHYARAIQALREQLTESDFHHA